MKIMIDVQSFPKRVFLKFPEESTHASEHTYQEEIYAGQESCTKLIAVVVNVRNFGNGVVQSWA